MALAVGTNSWVTVAEADTYLTNKIKTASWFALPDNMVTPGDESKENYLVSAFYWLYNNPTLELPLASTDPNVMNAQIEAAWFLLNYYDDYDKRRALVASGVKSFDRSKWSEDLMAVSIPDHILGFVQAYQNSNMVVQMRPDDYEDW